MLTIISTSLNPQSKSRVLAKKALLCAQVQKEQVDFIDLQTNPLPICDGTAASYSHPHVVQLTHRLKNATAIIIAMPVYNYTTSAGCKNCLELTGSEWKGKPVGIIAACGSAVSFMSPSSLILSLLLDFKCHVVPQLVMADASCFSETGDLVDHAIQERLSATVEQTILLKNALGLVQK